MTSKYEVGLEPILPNNNFIFHWFLLLSYAILLQMDFFNMKQILKLNIGNLKINGKKVYYGLTPGIKYH